MITGAALYMYSNHGHFFTTPVVKYGGHRYPFLESYHLDIHEPFIHVVVCVYFRPGVNYDSTAWIGISHENSTKSAMFVDGTTASQASWTFDHPTAHKPTAKLTPTGFQHASTIAADVFFCETKRAG